MAYCGARSALLCIKLTACCNCGPHVDIDLLQELRPNGLCGKRLQATSAHNSSQQDSSGICVKLSIVILRSPCCIQSVKYTAYRNRPFEHCQVLKGFIVADIRLHMGETSARCSLIVEGSEILQHGYMSQPRPSKAPSAELEVLFFPLPAHNQSTPVLQQDQLVEQPATSRPTDICSLGCVPDSSAAPPAAHIADRLLLSNTPQPPATCHSSDQHLTEAEIEVALPSCTMADQVLCWTIPQHLLCYA